MVQAGLILGVIILLGLVGRNYVVAGAAGVLLVLRLLNGEGLFPWLEDNALKIGIGIITMAILLPFASGQIGWQVLLQNMVSPVGLLAFATGIFVAYLGGRGVGFLTVNPQVMVGLMVGTIVGVAFFRGVPVGPLIAAGIMALVIGLINQ